MTKIRRAARETVLKALYAREVGKHDDEHVIETVIAPAHKGEQESIDFATRLYLRTAKLEEEANEEVRAHVANWELERLATVDLIILRMAVAELLTFEDIPTKVSINEAIELAKEYSTAKSGRFVNGILDAALESLEQQNRIVKKGRGLIDKSSNSKTELDG